jgi:hypothetical protein
MNDAMGAPVPLLAQAPRGRPLLGLAETRRPIVVVLGPQHSGTAVCAYALNLLGVDITEIEPAADPHERNASPDREIWERQPIRQFHDRIFELFDRDAAGPLYDFALPVAWWADPRLMPVRRDIVAFLEDRVTAGTFGFADARTVRLLPLWQQIFAELKLQAKFVLCLRNPGAAAGTARLREGLAPEIAEYRWFLHMADFFRYAGKVEHCAIEYERWREEPSANFDRLQDFLGFDWLHGAAEREMALAGIAGLADGAEPGGSPEPRQPMVRSFYRLARGGAQPGSAGPREQIVQQFVAFQQLQKPIEKALAAQASGTAWRPIAPRSARNWPPRAPCSPNGTRRWRRPGLSCTSPAKASPSATKRCNRLRRGSARRKPWQRKQTSSGKSWRPPAAPAMRGRRRCGARWLRPRRRATRCRRWLARSGRNSQRPATPATNKPRRCESSWRPHGKSGRRRCGPWR